MITYILYFPLQKQELLDPAVSVKSDSMLANIIHPINGTCYIMITFTLYIPLQKQELLYLLFQLSQTACLLI